MFTPGRHHIFLIVAIILAQFTLSFSANAQELIQTLRHESFSESYRSEVGVSGRNLRGISLINNATNVSHSELYLVLPAGPTSRLCVVLESQDARYLAELEYEIISRTKSMQVRLSIPTKHASILRQYRVADFGVSVRLVSNCNKLSGTYLPVIWGRSAIQEKMLLLVNAGVADISIRIFDRSKRAYYPCTKDNLSDKLIAFDTECEIDVTGKQGLVDWVIVNERNGQAVDDQEIKTYIP